MHTQTAWGQRAAHARRRVGRSTAWRLGGGDSGGHDKAPLTYANGVLYGGSTSGHMYAMDAATGKILWDYKGVGSSMGGPAVVNGFAYWGNGYTASWATEGSMFYAFALPKK
ncbi:PQQ-binding-like beta-propeller repeat protein [Actinoallomurus sp. NPDC052308]|uniref:PQQ-binding-like beta-propeller repeat protein n=1 Tax=Actinoallomurus sp. NPDC052308 TaxID=3155530 RepID=UPI00341CE6DF